MIILAIDTTTRGGSVAVTRDDERLSLVRGDETRTHGERLPPEIARALQEADVSKSAIDLIAVAAGPGAFTGLRIGLATAQGLALTLDRPVVGVSALDALAWTVLEATGVFDKPNQPPPRLRRSAEALRAKAEGLSPHSAEPEGLLPQDGTWRQTFRFVDQPGDIYIAPWMDAQRGDVFAALYRVPPSDNAEQSPQQGASSRPWIVVEPPLTVRPDTILESWMAKVGEAHVLFIGDAAMRDGELIIRIGNERWGIQAPDALAPAIASLGRRLALEGRAGKPHLITPIYVRRPDAEIERELRRLS